MVRPRRVAAALATKGLTVARAGPVCSNRVAAVRQFSRFYTRQLGLLDQTLLGSAYSLTEIRILFEIAHAGEITAGGLIRQLDIDAGYLSRLMRGFARRGLVIRQRNPRDARQTIITLSPFGRRVFRRLDQAADHQVMVLLGNLTEADQHRLLTAMETVMAVWPAP